MNDCRAIEEAKEQDDDCRICSNGNICRIYCYDDGDDC